MIDGKRGVAVTTTDTGLALQPMSDTQAREALASHAFGRLAINIEDGPTILPINYAFIESTIVIRTAPGSKLTFAPMTDVAFEIDDISPDRTWGWSVVARGIAFDITESIDDYSEMLRMLPFGPWLSNNKHHVIKIKVRDITGRWFGDAARVASSAMAR